MKTSFGFLPLFLLVCFGVFGQDKQHQISTIFRHGGNRPSSGYIAVNNKFTTLAGKHANLVEAYGGWFLRHRWLIGIEAAALTNEIIVPSQHRTMGESWDGRYYCGQFGLMTEYIFASRKAVHIGLQLFGGCAFTLQYDDNTTKFADYWNDVPEYDDDLNWFRMIEPGVKVEVNVFRWLRVCPGVTYRMPFGSNGRGMADKDVRGAAFNATVKIGRF